NSMRKTSAAISTSTSTATTSTAMVSFYPRASEPTPAVRPGSPRRSAAAARAGGVDPGGVDAAGHHKSCDRDDAAGQADPREAQGEARGPDHVVPQELDRDRECTERCQPPRDDERVAEHAPVMCPDERRAQQRDRENTERR